MIELMDLAGHHRFLCTLPLYYSGGRNSCLVHLMRGDSVVLYPSLFGPEEYVDQLIRHQITVAALVPSSIRQLLASPACHYPAMRSLHRLFSTGATLHPEEKHEAVRKLSPLFFERYGTAETLAISVLRPDRMAAKASSVGRPHSLVQIEIVDDSNNVLAPGEEGRMRIRGKGTAAPLAEQPDESRFLEGWFYPGEIAHLDEDGFIFLHGRTSDVIIRSGAKIYPGEVERVLLEHPAIIESAVIGHPAGAADQDLVAFVVPSATLSLGEVLAHCRSRLAPHKVPRAIRFLDQLPRNTAGKVDKLALAAQFEKLD
jgi:acyl-coenzyme A synthetase/AMP-(fatty) acid ligase